MDSTRKQPIRQPCGNGFRIGAKRCDLFSKSPEFVKQQNRRTAGAQACTLKD